MNNSKYPYPDAWKFGDINSLIEFIKKLLDKY